MFVRNDKINEKDAGDGLFKKCAYIFTTVFTLSRVFDGITSILKANLTHIFYPPSTERLSRVTPRYAFLFKPSSNKCV